MVPAQFVINLKVGLCPNVTFGLDKIPDKGKGAVCLIGFEQCKQTVAVDLHFQARGLGEDRVRSDVDFTKHLEVIEQVLGGFVVGLAELVHCYAK